MDQSYIDRYLRVLYLRDLRSEVWVLTKELDIPFARMLHLARLNDQRYLMATVQLLRTRSFRSEFRANIAKQIRDWFSDSSRKYAVPLSPRQIDAVHGFLVKRKVRTPVIIAQERHLLRYNRVYRGGISGEINERTKV